ncbi:hypothetical protein DPMN_038667 [Dreissena polymorpha]|uniref:Uncharacterized protein n=1 Tax=Dreissena polymorpha TaxID=45954 RepID=A0A9D4RQY5_DREPO|nr:hypothetical protein DPMN_038667 [Dreissena polymorpha]
MQTSACISQNCSVDIGSLHMYGKGLTKSPLVEKGTLQGQTAEGKPTEKSGWAA